MWTLARFTYHQQRERREERMASASKPPRPRGPSSAATASVSIADIYKNMTVPELHTKWTSLQKPKERDQLMAAIAFREDEDTFPSAPLAEREEMAGLYPDPADPQFASRLFGKREFYEARAVAAGLTDGTLDPCTHRGVEQVFERTPVQRIVSRFMSPMTPYMGLLLFHGVGVGKTCSAVSIAEQFLDITPASQVIVLVPQALQDNFKRTILCHGRDMHEVGYIVTDADGKEVHRAGNWCTDDGALKV